MTDVNPKELAARSKPPLDLLEYAAQVEIAYAMQDGATKYGVANYHTIPIHVRTYVAAAQRHLGQFMDGEDRAQDSGQLHLAHAGACIQILLGLWGKDNLIDDRGPQPRSPEQDARSSAANLTGVKPVEFAECSRCLSPTTCDKFGFVLATRRADTE